MVSSAQLANELTPVEQHGPWWIKRDDLFSVANVSGGKARSCLLLAQSARRGLVTSSARQSPQGIIVSAIAKHLGLSCRVHTAWGGPTPELQHAQRQGGELVFHRPGYNSVLRARARDDAAQLRWTLIPFGMEDQKSIDATALQVENVPCEARRLVVAIGSALTLCGILWGLKRLGRKLSVTGIVVGADPVARLNKWAPPDWREHVRLDACREAYNTHLTGRMIDGVALDPVYEAKCLPYLRDADCFWIVGLRNSAQAGNSCLGST